MLSPDEIKSRIEEAVEGAGVGIVENPALAGQSSLLIDHEHAVAVGTFLRDDPELQFDYLSNVTGVDWLARTEKIREKTMQEVDGEQKEITEVREVEYPAYLEAVYHLYSIERREGPLILRLRTGDREKDVHVPSLTPVWRSAEFQEREIYDLYGIVFDGHPDLRRILMWDEFEDHPMRKDYLEPDDYEYEPTPHDEVIEKTRKHYA